MSYTRPPQSGGSYPASSDPKIAKLLVNLTSERKNLQGANAYIRALQASSKNEAVIKQAQNEVRNAQANIKFLEDELAKLQLTAGGGGASGASSPVPSQQGQYLQHGAAGSQSRPGMQHAYTGQPTQPPLGAQHSRGPSIPSGPNFSAYPSTGSNASHQRGYSSPSVQQYTGQAQGERPLPPPPGPTGYGPVQQVRGDAVVEGTGQAGAIGTSGAAKNYTQLDLLRYDAPLSGPKITRMLHQLQFKLQVEEQYKRGIEKMGALYRDEGDKRLKNETEVKKVESQNKIQLLKRALKRYETLRLFEDAEDDEFLPDGQRKENLRKPLAGKLTISLKMAKDLNHIPLSRKSSKIHNETTVVIKIEGNERGVSHPSRNDKWYEDFEIIIDKANEVELTVYDQQTGGDPTPIGMVWFRISDIAEALRRQKVAAADNAASGQAGTWVTAAKAASMRIPPNAPGSNSDSTLHGARGASGNDAKGGEGIDGWFAVEPAGALSLHLNFVKENVRKRPLEAGVGGLGRQGAVRKRRGDVHEMNGHKFVQTQFYQPILCALCQEFLRTGEGYQCEDCRYACHKRCYPKVVTKCISKSNADTEGDEEKINHRIPHRFQPFSNLSASWCCHCGYMLPFGKKNARKCSECSLTCHAACVHLVPDFCGMTMEMANILLTQLRDIKTTQVTRKPVPKILPSPPASTPTSTTPTPAARIPPPQVQYPSSPAPAAKPPPGAYGVPVPAEAQYAAPPAQVNTASYGDRQPSQARIPPPVEHARPEMSQPPSQAFEAVHRPAPQAPKAATPPVQQIQRVSPPSSTSSGSQTVVSAKQPGKVARKVGLDDFDFLAVLGKGNFGKVMLAEEKKSQKLWAIKVLKKEFIIENDEVESTQSEKRVFLAAAQERHPFLLELHSCFQTETRIYFVMEYISGGDLMLHIQKKQFTLRQAKFYACEVLLALEYFHRKGIIYRDLKLDNILLTLDGHIKVADYGLCKESMWFGKTTNTFCGTPEFMAPEILLEQRYTRAVDWWAFGVLTYEMLLGQSPFKGDDEDEIFDAILEDEPLYPMSMPGDAVSLLTKLLLRDPIRRLGAGEDDAEAIKRHPFFRDVNFDDVHHKRIPPPYKPTIGNPTDVSNFDTEFTKEKPTLTPVQQQLSAADQAEFAGFSWTAPWAN
ncbi:hypothetical protein QFC22_004853 [Naganishia vaughanmartiniae]|uniref:Uncharacterized protein n=1 Tax=Naganishia vaughanmartiniae TaxID=1424756 RepID=A0ACC2X015_9TREE|nr:hypothetical protein QFC22_004853 [Naganishia vaughanmartiniae]